MSLVNQVLKDLQARHGETADTSGLRAAAPMRTRRGSAFWALVVGVAVVAGLGLFALERMLLAPAPDAAPVVATVTAEPTVQAVVVPEPDPEPVSVAESVAEEVLPEAAIEDAAPESVVETPPAIIASTESLSVPAPAETVVREQRAPEPTLQRTLVTESPAQRAADEYARGVRLLSEARRAEAEARFRIALSHDAAHHDARLALANLYAGDGRMREAEAQLQEGLRLAPHHAPLAERYARLLFDRDDLAGAIGVLTTAPPPVAAAPTYHALLAALLQRAGHHDAAADTYGALAALEPEQGLWWMGLGISLERADRGASALDAYTRAARDPRLSADVARFVRERVAALDQETRQ